jgi:hypothetical protein
MVRQVQKHLFATFGYNVVSDRSLRGTQAAAKAQAKKAGKDVGGDSHNYYVINNLKSPALFQLLAQVSADDAFVGFCAVVFQALYSSPGKVKRTAHRTPHTAHRTPHTAPHTLQRRPFPAARGNPSRPCCPHNR